MPKHSLQYGLDNGGRGPSATQEMRARPLLTRVYVAMNRLDVAAEQMARCRELMATDEDWRGRAGDVSRAEAILEAAHADYDLANRQFESALAIHQRYHSAWEQADTLESWGRALAAAGDHDAATQKFDAAIEIYRSRGAHQRFVDYVMADKLRVQNAPAASAASKAASFQREGDFWTISYDATTFRLKDAKGLHYIAYLLARPRQRIHVYDLIEAVEGSPANGKTIHAESEGLDIVRDLDGPMPTIDARARAEYRTRLRDLQADSTKRNE